MRGGILIFRWGGLGDLLVALPSLKLLREAYPGAEFTLVCRETYGCLFQEAGLVDKVVSADSGLLSGLFSESSSEAAALRGWLEGFHEVWSWMNREDVTVLARNLHAHGAGKVRMIGPPPASRSGPYYEHFFKKTASVLGRSVFSDEGIGDFCRMRLPGMKNGGPASLLDRKVIIHPGSGSRRKCWPLERFVEIAARMAGAGQEGVLVTGDAENWMEPILEAAPLPKGWSRMRRPPLLLLARELGHVRFYLGNDSGITHLAAACGSRVLALFRTENEIAWRPCGRANILSAHDLKDLRVEDVWNEILRLENCT